MSRAEILVAGATGTNGRALLDILHQRGVPARAFVRDVASAGDLAEKGFELAQGDLSDPASLAPALEGIQRFYVNTAVRRDAADLFANAFAAARAAGVRHVVKFSGLGADPAARPEIIRIHGASDATLIASGLDYTLLRPNAFFQNMLWQAGPIQQDGRFYLPLGESRQSSLDVRDIAEATANILTGSDHEGRAYDLTGPEALTCADMARQISALAGREVNYVPVPPDAAEQGLRAAGMPDWDARAVTELQVWFASGHADRITSDLAGLLGRPPRRFSDFVKDHADAFGGAG